MSVPTSVTELSTLRHVTLDIGGMTCASCVRRVEKALGRFTVHATERSLD